MCLSEELDMHSQSCILLNHFPCMVLLSKVHKETWSPASYKTHKMNDVPINEISNILHGENLEYLHILNTNQSFDISHNRLIEILKQGSPEVTVTISAKCKIKDLWVTNGQCRSAEKLSKLYKKLIGLEDKSCEVRKYKDYRDMYKI